MDHLRLLRTNYTALPVKTAPPGMLRTTLDCSGFPLYCSVNQSSLMWSSCREWSSFIWAEVLFDRNTPIWYESL